MQTITVNDQTIHDERILEFFEGTNSATVQKGFLFEPNEAVVFSEENIDNYLNEICERKEYNNCHSFYAIEETAEIFVAENLDDVLTEELDEVPPATSASENCGDIWFKDSKDEEHCVTLISLGKILIDTQNKRLFHFGTRRKNSYDVWIIQMD